MSLRKLSAYLSSKVSTPALLNINEPSSTSRLIWAHSLCHVLVSSLAPLSIRLELPPTPHTHNSYNYPTPHLLHPALFVAPSSTSTSPTTETLPPTMAAMDNGKAPLPTNGAFRKGGPGGDAGNRLINVQPPRREDLQPAYAQTLQGESEDAGSHGWYGSMSMLPPCIFQLHLLTRCKSTPSVHSSVAAVPSLAASFAPIHTSQSAKETSVWSPSSVASTVPSTQVS